mmetsp:Transcript_8536/g.11264  ORF Transcript_8536/g.11264 Transcript_8536/m.11264 type:complete len:460 (-) Transcript_8536:345-1724(-)
MQREEVPLNAALAFGQIGGQIKDEILASPRRASTLSKIVNDSQSGKGFVQIYERCETIGEGGFAFVFRCKHITNQSYYAVKEIVHQEYEDGANSLKEEIAAMKCLRESPYIVRLFDVFEERDRTWLVMEEMQGGDLLDRITEKETYGEADARRVARALLQAVRYMHNKGLAHRDIKPENILLMAQNDDISIKLCDFGCTKIVDANGGGLFTMAGSPQYAAPEVYDRTVDDGGYGVKCDLWSVGVVLFVMLGGYAPFEANSIQEMARMVCEGDWYFHEKYFAEVSDLPKDLIKSLMTLDPNERLTAHQALDSAWLRMSNRPLFNRSNSARLTTRPVDIVRSTSFDNVSLDDLAIVYSEKQNQPTQEGGLPVPMVWLSENPDITRLRREKRLDRSKDAVLNYMPQAPDLFELYSSGEDDIVDERHARRLGSRKNKKAQQEHVVSWERRVPPKGAHKSSNSP